jgi:hypothetical protein
MTLPPLRVRSELNGSQALDRRLRSAARIAVQRSNHGYPTFFNADAQGSVCGRRYGEFTFMMIADPHAVLGKNCTRLGT